MLGYTIEYRNNQKTGSTMSTARRTSSKSSNTSSSCDSGEFGTTDITVVKKGYISIKRPPSKSKLRLKAWQKRFILLRDSTPDTGSTRLEIYDCETSWKENRKHEQFIIKLDRITGVEEYSDSKQFADAFMVSRKGQTPLVLACETELEKKEWTVAIQLLADKEQRGGTSRRPSLPTHSTNASPLLVRPTTFQTPRAIPQRKISNSSQSNLNVEQSPRGRMRSDRSITLDPAEFLNSKTGYRVEISETNSSEHFGLSGPYVMHIETNGITLTRIDDVTTVIDWRLKDITKFKCEGNVSTTDDTVTLECKGLNGETEQFVFITRYGRDLVQRVTSAVSNRKSQEHFQQKVVRQNAVDKLSVLRGNLEKASSTPCLTLDSPFAPRRSKKSTDIGYIDVLPTTLPLPKRNSIRRSDNTTVSAEFSDDDLPSYPAPPPPPRPVFSVFRSQERSLTTTQSQDKNLTTTQYRDKSQTITKSRENSPTVTQCHSPSMAKSPETYSSVSHGSDDEFKPDLDTFIPALPARKISAHSK